MCPLPDRPYSASREGSILGELRRCGHRAEVMTTPGPVLVGSSALPIRLQGLYAKTKGADEIGQILEQVLLGGREPG